MDRLAARLFDFAVASALLAVTLPLVFVVMLAIWLADGAPAIYRAPRVGRGGRDFVMFKLRTMVPDADRLGIRLAPEGDPRITPVGAWLRRWKIDELPQLWNVLRGEMRLVGPRPDIREGVALYSADERRLLTVLPGMTDLASLWFVDEGRLLAGLADPLAHYGAIIRPIKSRLGLLYLAHRGPGLDLHILGLTGAALLSRNWTRRRLEALLARLNAQTAILSGALETARG
ncbi:MAG: sugar transferase [Sphingomonadales bacterium]|nr:MAG: sugar transferase [Sphingomonadales bacterium]